MDCVHQHYVSVCEHWILGKDSLCMSKVKCTIGHCYCDGQRLEVIVGHSNLYIHIFITHAHGTEEQICLSQHSQHNPQWPAVSA